MENRTLRNLGMNFYDATAKEGWTPQTFDPVPFGWYPLPGKPDEIFKKVDIPDLSESLDEIQFLRDLGASATAATSTKKGEIEQNQVTLGEVKLALAAANQRTSSTIKFSMLAQKEKADKFARLVNANPDKLDAVKLYKKGYRGNMFGMVANPSDWQSDEGYNCRVVSTAEKEQKSVEGLQKMNAARQFFPGNLAFDRITKERVLDFIGLNPEQTKEVMSEDEQIAATMPVAPTTQITPQANVPTPQPS
jgi:hypothetical protein